MRCNVWHVDAGRPRRTRAGSSISSRWRIWQSSRSTSSRSRQHQRRQTQGGATELETRIAFYYRSAHGSRDWTQRCGSISIPSRRPDGLTFAQLFPLARRLRALLGECRALDAQDFLPAAGGKASAVPVTRPIPTATTWRNFARACRARSTALTALADALDGPAAPNVDLHAATRSPRRRLTMSRSRAPRRRVHEARRGGRRFRRHGSRADRHSRCSSASAAATLRRSRALRHQ